MADSIKIAFIGGCLNKQFGIKDEDLYYNRITKDSPPALGPLIISLTHYNSYNELVPKANSLIEQADPEYLFVFIRPFPFWVLNKPVIKILTVKDVKKRVLHPSLFRRKLMTWPAGYSQNDHPIHSMQPEESLLKQALRDVNLILGMILGLNTWASRYVRSAIINLYELQESRTRVVIIGPPASQETFVRNYFCRLLNKSLKKLEKNNGIEFIDIFARYDSHGNLLFTTEGIHYTNHGHNFIKDKVINYLLGAKSERVK